MFYLPSPSRGAGSIVPLSGIRLPGLANPAKAGGAGWRKLWAHKIKLPSGNIYNIAKIVKKVNAEPNP